MNFRKLQVVALYLLMAIMIKFAFAKSFVLEEPQNYKHIVSQGDTVDSIAKQKGFSPEELIIYNKLDTQKSLHIGQIIYFPKKVNSSVLKKVDTSTPLNATAFNNILDKKHEHPVQPQIVDSSLDDKKPKCTSNTLYEFKAAKQDNILMPKSLENYVGGSKNQSLPSTDVSITTLPIDNIVETKLIMEKEYQSPKIKDIANQEYAINGNNELLQNVLMDFATNYNIPIVLEAETNVKVNGKISSKKPEMFLDHLASVYNFLWYYDGHRLFIYDNKSIAKQLITLQYLTPKKLKNTLQQMDIWNEKFYWKEQNDEKLVMISGPNHYIALVSETAAILDMKEGENQKSKLEVRSFPLKYAWATDKSFDFRGKQITVPGVASILKQIIEGGGIAQATENIVENKSLESALPYRQKFKNPDKQANQDSTQQLNAGAEVENVYINADPRLNAVIVHDLSSKMPMYEQIIESLDKPSKQIEIGISIIDINTEYLRSLGVEWSNIAGNSGSSFNEGNQPLNSAYTVISSTIGEFTAKIKMLSSEGKVKVVAKPSIITLDNLESIIDNSSTYYVSVKGDRDSELFPVTSGTVVRVTPHIIANEDSKNKIHLSVNIQDGSGDDGQSAGQAVKLPSTTNSSINTQAVVCEQESLLIGGFYKEREEKMLAKVPLLGDFPVLGNLFRSNKTHKIKSIRLFLITPLIISS